MLLRIALSLSLLFASVAFADPPVQGGSIPVQLPLFPQNNWWNIDISNAPVDPSSATYIAFIGGEGMHPDFGGDAEDPGYIYGIPFIVVDGAQAKQTVDFVEFGSQSDGEGVPFYPIPNEAITQNGWIEGGPPGNEGVGGDRHMLIVDKTNNHLYELYHSFHNGTNWEFGSGAFFNMNTNNRRPETWTSADAAGLAILPGLVRYDEVFGPDEIRHAFRMTVHGTNGHVYPASHTAGSTSGAPPMGTRLRLKASKNISGYPAAIQKIFRAMKTYGLIVADNGTDMYISGTYDTRWDNGVLNPAFDDLTAADFDVVQLGWHPAVMFVLTLPNVAGAGDAFSATLTAYDTNYNVATGYTGTVHFTSTDGIATLPVDYTFTPGDAGTHTFTSGFTLRTAGLQTITVNDTGNATVKLARAVAVGPATPAGFHAEATTITQVNVSWNAVPGATQYELVRGSAAPIVTASTSYADNTVTYGNAYVYKVRAVDASSRVSPYTAPDAATVIFYTDDPLVAGTTIVKAIHVSEVRTAVNVMRSAAGLGAASFTDPSLAGVVVKAAHITELRTALNQARAALLLFALTYTDPVPAVIKAAHVEELRNGVK